MRRWSALGAALAAVAVVTACDGDHRPPPLRQMSKSYSYEISPDEAPPHAGEDIHYTIRVFDRKTNQPIQAGDGQLFAGHLIDEDAPNGPQMKTWDGMAYGPEVGVYHAKLKFIVSGQWAVAIRFRRDTLHQLERIDWMQDVLKDTTAVP